VLAVLAGGRAHSRGRQAAEGEAMEAQAAPRLWERRPDETEAAFAAFGAYREAGPSRNLAAVARALHKHESLLRRWAARHRWRERAWAWDVSQAREEEATVRQHCAGVLRERLEDVDRIGRACLAFFRTLIRRDPETGEVTFDARFTPQVAFRFLELALRAQGAFAPATTEPETEPAASADLYGLPDAELMALIDLARERADQQNQGRENGHEPDQPGT
jgi:hypothetical protein